MAYPEYLISPMREELSHRGFIETRSPEQVDELLTTAHGTVLMVINSVCGCAAGSARPGVIQSLEGDIKPDKIATVFAGGDIEAVAHLRKILSDYPPSSPSVVLFRDGAPAYMLHRHEIEGRDPSQIAAALLQAYQNHCVTHTQAVVDEDNS